MATPLTAIAAAAGRATFARCVAAWVAALAATLLASATGAAPAPVLPQDHFVHRPHLDARFRDQTGNGACTKCHSFEGDGAQAYLSPYRHCEECHQSTAAAKAEQLITGHQAKLAELPAGTVPFRHGGDAHARIACLQCHVPTETGTKHDIEFEVRRDLPLCARCHADHSEQLERNRPLLALLMKVGADQCLHCHLTGASDAARPRNNRQFLHRDHLSHDDLSTGGWTVGACARCHRKVVDAGPIEPANYGALFLGAADAGRSCGDCHRDQEGRVQGLAWERQSHAKVANTFSHKVHVAQADLKNCATCHAPSASGEPQTSASYEACVGCHQHVDRKVEHHGEAAGCQRCHQLPSPLSLETAQIATTTVKREDPEGFTLGTHAHPGVTIGGGPLPEENCTSCHRGTPATLLRARPRPFSHSSHLVGTPTTADCLVCHKNVVATVDNGFDRAFDDPPPGSGLSCAECHKGSDFATKRRLVERTVPRFSHRSHMNSTRRTLQCAECHKVDPANDGRLLVPDAKTCRDCHNHNVGGKRFPDRPDLSDVTGGKELAALKERCAYCHAPDPNSGFAELAFSVERASGRLEPGKQWHDRGGGCAQCHGMAAPGRGPLVPQLTQLRVIDPHKVDRLAKEPFNQPPKPDGSNCAGCHTGDQVHGFLARYGGGRR